MKYTFFKGLILGSAVGGVYGLIKSPSTGDENREYLKEYIDETTVLVNDVTMRMNELKGAVSALTNEGKAVVNEFSAGATETVQTFSNEAEPRLRRIQGHTEKLTQDAEKASQSLSSTQQGNAQ